MPYENADLTSTYKQGKHVHRYRALHVSFYSFLFCFRGLLCSDQQQFEHTAMVQDFAFTIC